ncbi:MAG: peptide-methionine (S)-S-oxide reductase MsrA, partial [Gemmatimonadaceae bacterium]
MQEDAVNTTRAMATLGGGCFWCLEAVYQEVDGIESIVSGYAGGYVANPTYEEVCGKETGHAEVVQLTYDPAKVSYRTILEVFFAIHDPTTPNRQGGDVGPQYRSVIYTHDESQAREAHAIVDELTRENVFEAPIV